MPVVRVVSERAKNASMQNFPPTRTKVRGALFASIITSFQSHQATSLPHLSSLNNVYNTVAVTLLVVLKTMRFAILQCGCFLLIPGVVHSFAPTSPSGTLRLQNTASLQLCAASKDNDAPKIEPDILKPFPPAADPMYSVRGPVGEGDFVLTRSGGPVEAELTNENLLKILMIECSDLEVNTLVWKCLGYRFDEGEEEWKNDEVFPKWKEKYPSPPDLIGMQRIYSKEVDQPSLRANQAIVRSIPVDNKQSLKTHLKPLGFTGYKVRSNVVCAMSCLAINTRLNVAAFGNI